MVHVIITTINEKSKAIEQYELKEDVKILLIGDKKSHLIESNDKLIYLSIEDQKSLGFKIVEKCPFNHYARKNIGYLYALEQGAEFIYHTDDDNIPYNNWSFPAFVCDKQISSNNKYCNTYSHFSDEFVWPRGFPLDEIHSSNDFKIENTKKEIGVWQGMADINPDVDAIYRLVFNKEIKFKNNDPVALPSGSFCPFNSQNTLWNHKLIPYAYLPSTTSFRFTDILRGYITQRVMWEYDLYLGFVGPNVYQERNPHNLMNDFKDEIECYLGVKQLVEILMKMKFSRDPMENMNSIYKKLASIGMVHSDEVSILNAWLSDLEKIL